MLQILPRILIQTVLQKTEYGVTLDILSALDLYTNILGTFITTPRIYKDIPQLYKYAGASCSGKASQ
jgi:hypothetical protein